MYKGPENVILITRTTLTGEVGEKYEENISNELPIDFIFPILILQISLILDIIY